MSISSFSGIFTELTLSVMTAMEVTSEPVPLVVGMATSVVFLLLSALCPK